ncbi:MAG: prepilin peptidase [Patescibacteria group bacterium]
MFFLIYIYIFLIGLCVGSFLNVVIDRVPKHQKLVKPRSGCPFCKKPLLAKDLFPLLSFCLLKGKCRFCKNKIDKTLPIVELLTGLMFVLVFNVGGLGGIGIINWVEMVYYLAILCILIIVFFMDLKYGVIEDKVVLAGVGLWTLYVLISKGLFWDATYNNLRTDAFGKYLIKAGFMNNLIFRDLKIVLISLICAVSLFLFFYILVAITKGRGMGGGDVKFAFLMGLILGFPKVLPAFFLSFLTGALVSLILMLVGKKTMKQTVPFGPFLVTGTVLGLFWGDLIVKWYLGFL